MEEWQSQLPEIREDASAYELEALADDLVTVEEHEAGFEAMVRCIHNLGGRVRDVSRDDHGWIDGWGVTGDVTVADRCQERFFQYIRLGFTIAINPDLTPGALMRLMVECLEEAGITYLPADAVEGEFSDLLRMVTRPDGDGSGLQAFDACYEEHG